MTAFALDKNLSIEPEFGALLRNMVISRKPEVVVEIGTGQGYSTSWILNGLNENKRGKVFTFDSENRSPYVWEVDGTPSDRLEMIRGEFLGMGDRLPKNIDIVFHDAGHWFEHVETDLALVIPRMNVGGTVLVHDIVYSKDMGERLKIYFEGKQDWSYREIKDGCGMGVAEKIS